MWAPPRRLRRARIILFLLNVFTVWRGAIAFSTGDISQMGYIVVAVIGYYLLARVGFRCARCGKSPVFWSAGYGRARDFMNVVQRPDCPYCGFNVTYTAWDSSPSTNGGA